MDPHFKLWDLSATTASPFYDGRSEGKAKNGMGNSINQTTVVIR
jgi:hypothetical protein